MNETDRQEVIIAPGVAESIVFLAISQVEGVAQVGPKTVSVSGGLLGAWSKKNPVSNGVLILEEDGQITVEAHVKLFYGYRLQEVAANIRAAVHDALLALACIEVARVDITIDGIIFKA